MLNWRTRTLAVALLALATGHALAYAGLVRGLPAAPWGDEAQYWSDLFAAVLRIVWMPWSTPPADAHSPAAFARGIVPLVLLWMAGETLVRQFRNPLRLLRILRRGHHAVLLGLSPIARHVLAHWSAAQRLTLVVSAQHGEEHAAIAGGAAFVAGDWRAEHMPQRAAIGHASALACVAATDMENIDAAFAMTHAAARHRHAGVAPLVVFVKVEDPFLRARIDERIDRFALLERVQLRLFSAAQIAVRRLLRECPLERYSVAGHPTPRLWIFGFGTFGEEIVVEALRLSPGRLAAPCVITVVDHDAASKRASFLARWPGATELGRISFVDGHAEEGAVLLDRLLADAATPTALYFCREEETANLAAALMLCQAMRERKLHIAPHYLRGGGAALRDTSEGVAGHPWIFAFGDDASVAKEFLLGERLDAAARATHESYLAEAMKSGEEMGARRSLRPWLLLSEDLKDDNRFASDHHFVKLRAAGCTVRPLAAGEAADPCWSAPEVEVLAEFEHERWMAQRLLTGWRFDAKRDDERKLHPDLVPYGALGERIKELDRAVVRGIPARMAALGLAVVRETQVDVSGPASPWAFAPSFETAVAAELEMLKARAAGNSLLVWCAMRSAMACRVAELAQAIGARIGVVLDEPEHVCLARQPSEESRARVFRLLRAAERILVSNEVTVPGAALRFRLSIDGGDLQASVDAWGIDSAGRVLFRPQGSSA